MDKIVDIATDTTAATGTVEVLTNAQAKTALDLTGTNSGDQTSIVGITGTKAQFDTAVTDGNILYVGDVTSNATHTGQVTGATALALDVTAVTAQPASGVIVGTDTIIINDGGVLSEATMDQVKTFAGGGSGTVTASGSPLNNEVAVFATATDINSDSTFTWDGTTMFATNVTGTNIGGITSGSLVDKAAGETITGVWRHEVDDAATAALVTVLEISATSTGTPAVGFGPSIDFYAEVTAGSPGGQELAGKIAVEMTDLTVDTEYSEIVFYTMDVGGAAEQRLAIGGTPGGATILTGSNAVSLFAGANEVISGGAQTELFYSGTKRFGTAVGGDVQVFSDGNTSTEGRAINYSYQNGTSAAELGFRATARFDIHNNINAGGICVATRT